MRILITTGIFEPEVGGPATLAPKIASRLVDEGWNVTVITYSDTTRFEADSTYPFCLVRVVRRGNRLLNYGAFFLAVLSHMRGVDLIYSLDWLAAGLPVTLAAKVWHKPVVLRVGGDYVWERYLETDEEAMTLRDFYSRNVYRRSVILYRLIRFVLRRATHVIFNTDVQRELYQRYYGLAPQHTSVIYNPVPKAGSTARRDVPSQEIVFAGRFVRMKNLLTLIRAFAGAKLSTTYRLVLIGNGPEEASIKKLVAELHLNDRTDVLPRMGQEELYEHIRNCRALVLPSWTDISPNQVYEAMQLKIPMLVTKENYLSIREQLPETIDPASTEDISRKLEMLADDMRYQEFVRGWGALSFEYDWDMEMREHKMVFDSVLKT